MEPPRNNRLQETIRQWLLFIPLATAVVGSLLVQQVSEYNQAFLLPALFYVGALIVTAAMLHQRRLLKSNIDLNEQLHIAHAQLDDLHRLAVTLSQSLDVDEISNATLEHTCRMVKVDAGALWLRCDFLPPEVQRWYLPEASAESPDGSSPDGSTAPVKNHLQERWVLIASLGFEDNERRLPCELGKALDEGRWQRNELHYRVGDEKNNNALLQEIAGSDDSLVCMPITMKGEVGGMILVKRKCRLHSEHVSLLQNIALISGQALHNSLHYRAASLRAEMDGLTNLYNHRATQERLVQEVARVQRMRKTNPDAALAVGTMDINDFKIFNDTYGHATGDRVLRTISDTLRQTFRASDVVGRFGGDEFVMILPDTNRAGAEIVCERAIKAVAAQHFEASDGSQIQIRMTCGVADFPDDAETAADLLRVSDARLYVAKRRGVQIVENEAKPVQLMQPRWSDVGVLEALVTAIDNKDRYTRFYSEQVWRYTLMIARRMKLSQEIVQAAGVCGLVHDVGKIIVPDSILRKPGRLTADEMQVMQQHTVFGTIIVRDVPHLDLVLGGVRHHHENYDGSGYPDKLSGENIPLLGRLLAVPVNFAAMITDRPYRKALTVQNALDEIRDGAGRCFDPEVVEAFLQVIAEQNVDNETDAVSSEALVAAE